MGEMDCVFPEMGEKLKYGLRTPGAIWKINLFETGRDGIRKGGGSDDIHDR
jgi:hypothetical protein